MTSVRLLHVLAEVPDTMSTLLAKGRAAKQQLPACVHADRVDRIRLLAESTFFMPSVSTVSTCQLAS